MSDLKANIVCVYVVSSQASLKEENNRKYQRKKRCKERPSRPLSCLYVKRPQTTRGINHFHLFSNNDLLWDTGNMHAPTPTHCMRYMLPWHLDLTTGAATSQDETHSSFRYVLRVIYINFLHLREWRQHSPSTKLARVQILASTPYAG